MPTDHASKAVPPRPTRRQFLGSGIAAGLAAWAVPALVPARVFAADAPSNRINLGFIGLGNQSTIDLPTFLANDDVQILAVCDVNRGSHGYKSPEQLLGREPGQAQVETHYAAQTASGQYRGCAAYNDFREILARDDIDAVVVVVPDHWHAVMTILAAQAGKDVYCEKPLSLTIAQGQAMIRAIRQHQRVLQTGSQLRSSPATRRGCELVRNGRIGKVQRVIASIPPNNMVSPGPGWQPAPVPDGFDYDRWLGPAPKVPYHPERCLYRFRFNFDYSGGQVTNFGAHALDIAQWGLGTDQTGPVEVACVEAEWPPVGSLFNTALKVHFRARYANGVELECRTGPGPSFSTRFEGTDGWVEIDVKGLKTYPESLGDSVIGPQEIHLPVSNPQRTKTAFETMTADQIRNFLDCVKSRQDPIEPVETGHRTATICHLGNIAMRLNRKLQWNPDQEKIVGDAEAQAMLSRPMREPWHL